uniref:Leucine-rich repeat-containing N-terminal plant-type domain-containing protein n=1 Tax=Cyclophora tenuis TaxID=216820 RepID=A0A6U1S5Y9_CYCTE
MELVQQRYALTVLLFAVGAADKTDMLDNSKHECDWDGNLCNENQQLDEIYLYNNRQTGSVIPPEVGLLVHLEYLDLQNNQLQGTVPAELDQLTNLRILNLRENEYLRGEIPTALCSSVARLTGIHVDCMIQCTCCNYPAEGCP